MSPARTLNDDRTLGRIEERLDNLIDEFKSERTDRRAQTETITAMGEALRVVTRELSEIKPLALDYRDNKTAAMGAARAGKLIWGSMVGMAALIGAIVTEIARYVQRI